METNLRIEHEKEHGTLLSEGGAEDIWNWGSPAGKARAQRRSEFFSRCMQAGQTCLELGCGTGFFTRLVAFTGAKIIAVDISEDLLEEARSKTDADNVTYEIADAHNLKYDDNTFDFVYGSSILHHLEIGPAMKEILRVLKPGGKMVFAEPNLVNPQIWAERNIEYVRKKVGASPDETAFVRFTLEPMLKGAGFVNIDIKPHEFLHPAIPEKLIGFGKTITGVLEKIPLLREIGGSLLIEADKPYN
ncbi:MAG: methyltransferase domain-containing protein [Deltaproteobacteria bacterium]|nr:methyltransferase domain-containing protein [Deltaproteobacteria bacterium]